MRIVSWNVNGLRRLRPVDKLLEQLRADIVCFQEVRVSGEWDPDLESLAFVKGYHSFFSICKQKRGYSGVATFCKRGVYTPYDAGEGLRSGVGGAKLRPDAEGNVGVCIQNGCPCEKNGCSEESLAMIESEGRCVITDHQRFVLINVYIPAVSVEGRIAFKMQFLHALQAKVELLRKEGRHVIVVGDYNICPAFADVAEPIPASLQGEWLRRPSRTWMRNFLDPHRLNFVDSYRELNPHVRDAFSCWSEATRGRENNFGVRIDLIVLDRDLFITDVCDAHVHADTMGSDHCPVSVTMRDCGDASSAQRDPPQFCTANMQRFAYRQKTLTDMLRPPGAKAKFGRVSGANKADSRSEAVRRKRARFAREDPSAPHAVNFSKRGKDSGNQARISNFFTAKDAGKDTLSSRSDELRSAGLPNQSLNLSKTAPIVSATPFQTNYASTDAKGVARRLHTANAWRKLLSGPPPPPKCKHGLPCVLKTVGKAGENKGRTFFSCPYPAGVGKTADCHFFKWAPFKGGMATLPH